MLEQQLSKGGVGFKEPQLVRQNFHADEELDQDDTWKKKRRAQEKKADEDFDQERYENPSRGSHGEEFHSDNEDIDYSIKEVDREFDRESRPAKSKAVRDTYIGDDQGEKQYTYKSNFLDAILEDLTKSKDPTEKMAKQAATIKKEKMGKKQMMNLANLHENSDGVVEKKIRKGDPMPLIPSKKAPKQPKDEETKQIEAQQKKEMIGAEKSCKKSDIDELYDIVKGEYFEKKAPKGVDPAKHERCVTKVKQQGHDVGSAHAICTSSMKKKSFVKSEGKGGIVFDFGPLTGNPLADHATALLNRHADPIQMNNAKYQQDAYGKAISDYVTKGDAEYSQTTTPFGEINKEAAEMIDKPMDQQVAEAFAKGQLDSNPSNPAVINKHNEKQISVGSEVIKATSETDAALIEMMKAQGMDLSDMASAGAVDVSSGGAIKVVAGLE